MHQCVHFKSGQSLGAQTCNAYTHMQCIHWVLAACRAQHGQGAAWAGHGRPPPISKVRVRTSTGRRFQYAELRSWLYSTSCVRGMFLEMEGCDSRYPLYGQGMLGNGSTRMCLTRYGGKASSSLGLATYVTDALTAADKHNLDRTCRL